MLRRLIRLCIYLALVAIVVVLAGAFILYRRTPDWYRPVHLTHEQCVEAANGLRIEFGTFQDKAGFTPADKPIVLKLTQDQVNGYLQALLDEDTCQVLRGFTGLHVALPDGMTDPLIVFQKDRLILAARYAKLGKPPVSLHLKLSADPETIDVAIESIRVGSLPLPKQFIRDQLSEIRYRVARAAERLASGDEGGVSSMDRDLVRLGAALFAAIDGEPMGRDFVTSAGAHRPMRLDRLELADGRLTVVLIPQGEAATRRRSPQEMGVDPWQRDGPAGSEDPRGPIP